MGGTRALESAGSPLSGHLGSPTTSGATLGQLPDLAEPLRPVHWGHYISSTIGNKVKLRVGSQQAAVASGGCQCFQGASSFVPRS